MGGTLEVEELREEARREVDAARERYEVALAQLQRDVGRCPEAVSLWNIVALVSRRSREYEEKSRRLRELL